MYAPVLAGLPRWRASAPFDFDGLTAFYQENGCGLFARYRAFVWDSGELIPVADPDCPRPEELMGYELQRGQVVANTQAMLEGHLVNNVLLFGDGGTGKSATVKSMLFRPGFGDLRLIEVQKEGLAQMPPADPLPGGTAAEVHPLHRRPGFRPGRQYLFHHEDYPGGRAGAPPGQCGHLRHL